MPIKAVRLDKKVLERLLAAGADAALCFPSCGLCKGFVAK